MIGRVRRHSDPKMIFVNGKQVMKDWPNNKNQKAIEANDMVNGIIGTTITQGWAKFKGGADDNDPANYELSDTEDTGNFADY